MEAAAKDYRSQRGLALMKSKGSAIKVIVGTKYLVPSATGSGGYVVDAAAGTCTCADWETLGGRGRLHRCKHIFATLYVRREIPLPDGNSVVTEEKIRINYPRDWTATNIARTAIPRLGPGLLADLIHGMGLPPPPAKRGRGRPRVPLQDVLLAAALRAFEDTTAGAAVVAAENYRALGFVKMERVPSYNTLLREFAKPDVKYQVVHVTKAGIPFVKQLSKAGNPIGRINSCVGSQEDDYRDMEQNFRFELDPDFADSMLLQDQYDPSQLHRSKKEIWKAVTDHNKSVKLLTKTYNDVIKLFTNVNVGDTLWTSNIGSYLVQDKKTMTVAAFNRSVKHAERTHIAGSHASITVLTVLDKNGKVRDIAASFFSNKALYKERPRTYKELNI